ncbi:MAG: 23S rRNA (guanosine(2251)-2'-O)-methyltransferase RlmB, partial [Firmicutes bacterium]|nr:23S rRNA (guanosine(2251)-2'-O)-methyltransferase RlmB [Bacillota bacterium]
MILEGKNAVNEALKNLKPIDKILIKKGYENSSLRAIKDFAKKNGVVTQLVDKKKLDFLSETKNHQGI